MLPIASLLAQAAPAAGSTPAADPFGMLMPILFMFAIMYFLILRPQQKKQKELARQIGALKTGDKVILVGGEHGVITNVKETTFTIRIAENTKVEYEKSSVATVAKSEPEPAPAASVK